ncbi:copper chaperone CopZ [Lysinibacillus odysseyi]|uniref:Copper chaperone CopZ n=1 Tax=Lysinibacillus odysseyi 34hs-1 = NBRC 100172 TaxID=1220589 RepID=A0A0A3JNC9_9BACI|nr:copper chaperone CopZ [Lysinibacillus odysseyi]KGR88527.1 copper resistance protein CopZ [Lysinibacillus odysseyi 34hs-1 = NBRC 100172]
MENVTIQVKGMSCGHCVKAVECGLGQLEGVEKVAVQLDAGTVEVDYKEGAVTIEQMKAAIEDQGYDVVE